jgi:CRP/FNR family cyclic AMP-dependent transcriptional regulator
MSEEHGTMGEDEEVELFGPLSRDEIRELIRQNYDVRLAEGETFYTPWEHDGTLFVL